MTCVTFRHGYGQPISNASGQNPDSRACTHGRTDFTHVFVEHTDTAPRPGPVRRDKVPPPVDPDPTPERGALWRNQSLRGGRVSRTSPSYIKHAPPTLRQAGNRTRPQGTRCRYRHTTHPSPPPGLIFATCPRSSAGDSRPGLGDSDGDEERSRRQSPGPSLPYPVETSSLQPGAASISRATSDSARATL